MVRIWIRRNSLVADPHYAARDAAAQVLAVDICRSAGLDYRRREDGGPAEAFLTGSVEEAEQALTDLDTARIPVLLVEATSQEEANRLSHTTGGMEGGDVGGDVGGEPAEYGRHCKLELVTEFRRGV